MASSDELRTYAGRLATFDGPVQVSKRRASSTKKKTSNTVTWPHKSPKPDDLARAGFFYRPSGTHPDSVTCFCCHKSMDEWDSGDNPYIEHLKSVPACGWAINVCIEQRSQDMDRAEEDPMSEKMVESRRSTFQDSWPHEPKKGWKCKTQKMIDAGWCYSPLPEADDCVVCFYCGISLDGWEPKDDPWKEHHKRSSDCHFFTLVKESQQPAKANKGRKGASSRASKTSRMSTQSTMTVNDNQTQSEAADTCIAQEAESAVVAGGRRASSAQKGGRKRGVKKTGKQQKQEDSVMVLGDESVAQEEDSVLTAGTKNVPAVKKGVRKGGAGGRAAQQKNNDSVLDPGVDSTAEGDSILTIGTTASKADRGGQRSSTKLAAAPTRGSRAAKARKEEESVPEAQIEKDLDETDKEADDQQSMIAREPMKPTRATRQKSTQRTASPTLESTDEPASKQPSTKSKGKKKQRQQQKQRLSEDASQLQTELDAEAVRASSQPESAPTRGQKRTSDGKEKVDSSVVVLGNTPQPTIKRGRSKKMQELREPEQANDADLPAAENDETTPQQPPPKLVAKGKKGRTISQQKKGTGSRQVSRQKQPIPVDAVPEPALETEPEPEPEPVSEPESRFETAVEPEPEPEPVPKQRATSSLPPRQQSRAPPQQADTPPKTSQLPPKLSSSPAQSSDAENQPPSSRPSQATKPASPSPSAPTTAQAPMSPSPTRLQPGQAQTPRTSPSKRQQNTITGGLQSTDPWTAVDLEKIFLPSPSSHEARNGADVPGVDDGTLSMEQMMQRVSSPEKEMTVEEWIVWNAGRAEEKMKEECEGMIGVFEREGLRALKTVEGVGCY